MTRTSRKPEGLRVQDPESGLTLVAIRPVMSSSLAVGR